MTDCVSERDKVEPSSFEHGLTMTDCVSERDKVEPDLAAHPVALPTERPGSRWIVGDRDVCHILIDIDKIAVPCAALVSVIKTNGTVERVS